VDGIPLNLFTVLKRWWRRWRFEHFPRQSFGIISCHAIAWESCIHLCVFDVPAKNAKTILQYLQTKLAKNPEYHDKTKHIDIRHHYIRQLMDQDKVQLEYLPVVTGFNAVKMTII